MSERPGTGQQTVTVSQSRTEIHQTLLPPLDERREIEEIRPGIAERVVTLAERDMDLKEQELNAITRNNDQIHEETMFMAAAWA